jgi:hypothetical protein
MAITNPGPARKPALDPRRYIVGMDAELYLADGPYAGEFLLHVATWQLQGNIHSDTEQPPGHQLVQSVRTGVEFTLALTESTIRVGDQYLLKRVMDAIYAHETVYINFQGIVGRRSVLVNGQASKTAKVTIEDCEPVGQFTLFDVRAGGILRRPLNFHCNSVPWFDDYLT